VTNQAQPDTSVPTHPTPIRTQQPGGRSPRRHNAGMTPRRSPVTPVAPGPGQESVWDYPRPPALQESTRHVVVKCGDILIAETRSAWRVMETSHPPTWYLPPTDVRHDRIRRSALRTTMCEWKGAATYWDVAAGDVAAGDLAAGDVAADGVAATDVAPGHAGSASWREAAAWSYQTPTPRFVPISGFLSFMPSAVECYVDGERVLPQAGGFYGGWITSDVVGPFKGEPGSWGW